jgi:hypothetical protein
MPLVQYFGWVGSFLLAALLAVSWCLPGPVHAPSSDVPLDEKITIRIHSDRKWPERVEFDTVHPVMGPAENAGPAADVAPDPGLAQDGRHGPFDAFAEIKSGSVGPCFRPPCAARDRAGQDTLPGRKGVPSGDRSRIRTAAPKGLTSPNPLHKPPGKS